MKKQKQNSQRKRKNKQNYDREEWELMLSLTYDSFLEVLKEQKEKKKRK
jgi:hypothetical protein